jgi:hypothetical protein
LSESTSPYRFAPSQFCRNSAEITSVYHSNVFALNSLSYTTLAYAWVLFRLIAQPSRSTSCSTFPRFHLVANSQRHPCAPRRCDDMRPILSAQAGKLLLGHIIFEVRHCYGMGHENVGSAVRALQKSSSVPIWSLNYLQRTPSRTVSQMV